MTAEAQGAPRIPPGGRREIGTLNMLIATAIARAAGSSRPLNIFTTLGRHRGLFRVWLLFAGRLMPRGSLRRIDTELVILRVAHICGCEYEWRHHERLGMRAGLKAEQVAAVSEIAAGETSTAAGQLDAGTFSESQLMLLRAVDELHLDREISDDTWVNLRASLSETETIELCMLAGHYEMLAMTLNSLRVEPDGPGHRLGARAGSRGLLSTIALLLLVMGTLAVRSSAALASPRIRSGNGLKVLSEKQLDSRLLAVSVKTSALPGPANVRILLPSGYRAHPRRRYPVLYLLHGTSGGAADWTTLGHAEQTTAGRPLIVVMPDIALNDDGGGWCTNWPDGAYKWETFHIDQLIPWVDHNLRTISRRGSRAIAGLSQGGFCSMSYAARHPDLFGIALGYSGAPDIAYGADAQLGAMAIINATEVGLDRVPPDSMFGSPVTDDVNWAAHDPTTLAPNLRWTKLYMYFGNGLPGPYDSEPVNPEASFIEGAVSRDNMDFHDRLDALGIPSYFDPYGAGTHSWPYWARDLRWSIGAVMSDFAHPAALPAAITYASADQAYSVYGWRITTHRLVREFSTLQSATCHRFTLAGSGSATVTTPSCMKPGRRYRVVLSGRHIVRAVTARASRAGTLTVTVPLGPSNRYQQYTAQAEAVGTAVYRTHVSIEPGRTP